VRRIELLDRVWGMSFDPGTNLIDVHMANLRRKLEEGGGERIVFTVRGVGFQLGRADD
jgi:two-component system OmpR family response regulator